MMSIDPHWMTALEMQFAAVRVLDIQGKQYGDIPGVPGGTFQGLLRAAETFTWAGDVTKAVSFAARTIPGSSSLTRDMPPGSGTGWWWFETPVYPGVRGLIYGPASDNAIWFKAFTTPADAARYAIAQGNDKQYVQEKQEFLQSRAIQLVSMFAWSFKFGETVDDFTIDINEDSPSTPHRKSVAFSMVELSRFFLAGCAWLQQRILCHSSGHVERHRRKQLAREHNVPIPSDVKVIQLRRTESQSRPTSENGESVDWSCRWIVNGHWRNQPYKDERKLIYIMPFVKGPNDKPLKVPTHTVYQVSR